MKIVIDIRDYVYCDIQAYNTIFSDEIEEVAKAIKNGIPLPEGNEDLIDRDDLYNWLSEADVSTVADALSRGLDIKELPAIIGADY